MSNLDDKKNNIINVKSGRKKKSLNYQTRFFDEHKCTAKMVDKDTGGCKCCKLQHHAKLFYDTVRQYLFNRCLKLSLNVSWKK